MGSRGEVGGADQTSTRPTSVDSQRLAQANLGHRQQLRYHREVTSARLGHPEHRIHIDTDDVAARGEPQLASTGEQHVPGLMFLLADQGVLAVGAEPPVASGLASRAGEAFVVACPAVLGPSARLEVPAAESADRSPCRWEDAQRCPSGKISRIVR